MMRSPHGRKPLPIRRATGKTLRRLAVPAHHATTRTLQAIYPLMVDSALGVRARTFAILRTPGRRVRRAYGSRWVAMADIDIGVDVEADELA